MQIGFAGVLVTALTFLISFAWRDAVEKTIKQRVASQWIYVGTVTIFGLGAVVLLLMWKQRVLSSIGGEEKSWF